MGVIRERNSENNLILEWTSTIIVFGVVFYSVLGIFKRFRASMTFQNVEDTSNNVTVIPKLGTYRSFNEESLIIERNPQPVPQYNITTLNERMNDMNINTNGQLKLQKNSQIGSNKTLNLTLSGNTGTSQDDKPRILKDSDDSKAKKKTKISSKSSSKEKKKKKDKNDESKSDLKILTKEKKEKSLDENSTNNDEIKKKGKDKKKDEKKEDSKTKAKKEKKVKKDGEKSKKSKSLLKNNDKNTLVTTSVPTETPNKNVISLNKNSIYSEPNEYEVISEIPNITFSSNWDMVNIHRQNLQNDIKVQPPATNLREMALQRKENNINTKKPSRKVQNISMNNYSSNDESDTNA